MSLSGYTQRVPERGLVVDRCTVERWVQRCLPLFQAVARPHRQPIGITWRVDETYTRLGGTWTYIERAIDQDGQVVDAYFSERRNARAGYPLGETFFTLGVPGAIDETGMRPKRVTMDKATCYPPALRAVLADVEHRTSQYLNHGMERDHGQLKQQ